MPQNLPEQYMKIQLKFAVHSELFSATGISVIPFPLLRSTVEGKRQEIIGMTT